MEAKRPMNFFTWIREGVRQAVLMGVTDAVDGIGTPPSGDDMSQKLMELIRSGGPRLEGSESAMAVATLPSAPARRRKLGRTLSEIQAGVDKDPE
jgi:hypothetical protein